MKNGQYVEMCAPCKVASSMICSLMIRYVSGQIPRHFPLPWPITDLKLNRYNVSNLRLKQKADQTYLFVRNPYARLLSGFLDKIVRPDSQMKLAFPTKNLFKATPDSFRTFVQNLTDHPQVGNRYARSHFLPIMNITHSKCIFQATRVLKLEDMHSWYGNFVSKYDMFDAVNDPKWPGKCWWHPKNATCKTVFSPNHVVNAASCTEKTNYHTTGSCRMIHDYYDDETREKVFKYAQVVFT
jgi:hypothetical protein